MSSIMNRPFSQMWISILSCKSSAMTDERSNRAPLCTNLTTYTYSPRSWHLPHTLRNVGDGFRHGECFSRLKIESRNAPHNRRDLWLTLFFIKHSDTATNSVSGNKNTDDFAESLTATPVFQKPPVPAWIFVFFFSSESSRSLGTVRKGLLI
jgi:hypothetical protein